MTFVLLFQDNKDLTFHASYLHSDHLHEIKMSQPVFCECKKNISKCHLLKFLSSLQSIKFISMIMSIDGRAELFGHNMVT